MFLKKTLLLGTTLAISTFAVASSAVDLTTYNRTALYSTVLVHGTKCAGSFGKYTTPGGTVTATPGQIRTLCDHTFPCTAVIVVAKSVADIMTCRNTSTIGNASLTINPGEIPTIIGLQQTGPYTLTGLNTSTLTIG